MLRDGRLAELGIARPDDADRLRHEDRDVSPGELHAYQLAHVDDGATRFTSGAWVEVPQAPDLTLEGFRRNSVAGSPVVAFTLPTDAPARA